MDHWSMEHQQQQGGGAARGATTSNDSEKIDLKGGRPKGTTAAATRLLNIRKRKAPNDVTLQFIELKQSAHGNGIMVKRG